MSRERDRDRDYNKNQTDVYVFVIGRVSEAGAVKAPPSSGKWGRVTVAHLHLKIHA